MHTYIYIYTYTHVYTDGNRSIHTQYVNSLGRTHMPSTMHVVFIQGLGIDFNRMSLVPKGLLWRLKVSISSGPGVDIWLIDSTSNYKTHKFKHWPVIQAQYKCNSALLWVYVFCSLGSTWTCRFRCKVVCGCSIAMVRYVMQTAFYSKSANCDSLPAAALVVG